MADPATRDSATAEEQHVLALLVSDRAGAIERVLGVLRRRAPGISTVSVAATEELRVMSVTIGLTSTRAVAEHAVAHLCKLVDVRWAAAMPTSSTDGEVLLRELALIRVACDARTRREIVDLAHLFAARPVGVTDTSVTLEVSGPHEAIENLLRLLRPLGIRELARTGRVAMRQVDDQRDQGKEATPTAG